MFKKEYFIEKGLFALLLMSILIVVVMVLFIVTEAIPVFAAYGISDFLFGTVWSPDSNEFGIFPMVVSTLMVTAIALIIAVPLSISCAIFLEEIASSRIRLVFRPIIQTLSGIPSVVYGFFGLTFLVPLTRQYFGGSGFSILTASAILAVMILPTVISVTQDSIRAVPQSVRQSSLALGATRFQTIRNVVIPSAFSGIFIAVVLGLSRAVGETLAVLMLVGNVAIMPDSALDPARTLSSNIALEMSYAGGIHYNALFATALVLLGIVIVLMIISNAIKHVGGIE